MPTHYEYYKWESYNNSLEIQEFMIRPDGAKSFQECMQMSFLIIQRLKKKLEDKKFSTSVGDEGDLHLLGL